LLVKRRSEQLWHRSFLALLLLLLDVGEAIDGDRNKQATSVVGKATGLMIMRLTSEPATAQSRFVIIGHQMA
jgi:hypothetical protein